MDDRVIHVVVSHLNVEFGSIYLAIFSLRRWLELSAKVRMKPSFP